jgi:DNA-binding response OmpR family regulator/HPt (histidine-containing phosphotransfer) domain-containing protein
MRILVVEDDELIVEALTVILTSQNYTIEVATDGEAGLSLIESFEYDLILLDVMLPKLDGVALCRQVRAKGLLTPILLLTGRDSGHDKAIGLDAGADDYVVKPFDEEELVARIRALLRRGSATTQPILEWGDLRLDPLSCEVTYANQPLNLTPKEYSMLELFLRNSRRVFSCGMILEHLWSYPETPGEEAVRTHIKGLRQKLKAAGASGDWIETVYGIGYRLKPLGPKPEDQSPAQLTSQPAGSHPPATAQPTLHQQTSAQIAALWNRFKGRIGEQVAVIEQAIEAAKTGALTSELRGSAMREAHTLAGSLGTFGLPNGSLMARHLEHTLKAETKLTRNTIKTLNQQVVQLRQDVENHSTVNANDAATEKPFTTSSDPYERMPDDKRPLLLIIDRDGRDPAQKEGAFIDQLKQVAAAQGLETIVASTLASARKRLYQDHPSVVLLNSNIASNLEDSLDLIAELNQRKPPVPVLLIAEEPEFGDFGETFLRNRIRMAQSGRHTLLEKSLLEKSISAERVIEVALRVLHQTDPSETKILAVDDDPKILAVLQTLLQPWGFRVIALADPREFWQTLEAVSPDLLLLDIEMPHFSGIDLCQTIRNDARWSELPIVFLTVHKDAEMVNQVFAMGADDFVSKPIVGPELVTRIVNRLERNKLARRVTQLNQARSNQGRAPYTEEIEEAQDLSNTQGLDTTQGNPEDCLRPASVMFKSLKDDAEARLSECTVQLTNLKAHLEAELAAHNATEPRLKTSEAHATSRSGITDNAVYGDYPHYTDRKQVERLKNEFVSLVSHELRTPLTSIHGALRILASGLLSADSGQGKRLLQIAVDSTDRLVDLINDILDVERIESGSVKMNKTRCNSADIVVQAIQLMQPAADRIGATISVSNPEIELVADCDRIVQVLTNLLSNAIKFSPFGSTVWLSVERQPDRVLFTVKDEGCGIPTDKLGSIFDRFQQADSSDSRHHDGTGLGLTICRSVVQQHQGQIWVESVVGQGSTFYFTLPLLDSLDASIM